MRILVLGAGVIGSVYAGKLSQAGHEVVVLGRGARLADLRVEGLVLEDAESGQRAVLGVRCVGEVGMGDRFDLVLVPVRAEQLPSTLPLLTAMDDGSDVLIFGNPAGHRAEIVAALGGRALFGFPAAGARRVRRAYCVRPMSDRCRRDEARRRPRHDATDGALHPGGVHRAATRRQPPSPHAGRAATRRSAHALPRSTVGHR